MGVAALGQIRNTGLMLLLAACSGSSHALDGPAAEVRTLVGARTRVVWVQGDGTDPYAAGDQLVLMGFDTDDGRGERVILSRRGSYVKPLLTPAGNRIVFSTRPDQDGPEVFVVGWDGSGLRQLAKGFALAVWRHPVDGREWVYVGTDNQKYDSRTVARFPIDDPNARGIVWNKTMVSGDTFQVSADGRRAGGLFPWPDAGVASLPNGTWQKFGEGCWTALNDVRGSLFWYFDGSHRNLTMVDVGTSRRWTVSINQAPGFAGAEVYHPRWTNHPRFLAISGPYNQGGDNQVRSGGRQSEVYLGRFSPDYTRVEAWARVTRNGGGDSYPDVWIDRSGSPYPAGAGSVGPRSDPAGSAGARGSGGGQTPRAEHLVVEVRLVKPGSVPSPQAIAPYRHALVANLYEVASVLDGQYSGRQILVAQWALRDGRVLAGARKAVGTFYRLSLEPYDAHPELEGERLILDSDAPALRLYYEVGAR